MTIKTLAIESFKIATLAALKAPTLLVTFYADL